MIGRRDLVTSTIRRASCRLKIASVGVALIVVVVGGCSFLSSFGQSPDISVPSVSVTGRTVEVTGQTGTRQAV